MRLKIVNARLHTMKLTRRCLIDNKTLKKIWFTLNETMRRFVLFCLNFVFIFYF